MNGIDSIQLRLYVVRPVLQALFLWTPAAENLMIGTAMVESELVFIQQMGKGPARGLWQMEPATHDDCWQNYLRFRDPLKAAVLKYALPFASEFPDAQLMAGNLYYACAMARIKYARVSQALPDKLDDAGMANYHKTYYNTAGGATDPAISVQDFKQAIREGAA